MDLGQKKDYYHDQLRVKTELYLLFSVSTENIRMFPLFSCILNSVEGNERVLESLLGGVDRFS